MMAKGTYAGILLSTKDVNGASARLQAGGAEVVRESKSRPSSRMRFATAPSVIPRVT